VNNTLFDVLYHDWEREHLPKNMPAYYVVKFLFEHWDEPIGIFMRVKLGIY